MSSETHTVWEDINGLGRWRIHKWSPPTTYEPPADLLHPLATIQWETCWELEGIYLCAIYSVDNDRLYLGSIDDGYMVLEFSADLAAWKVLPLPPTSEFTLSTYHSQLVLGPLQTSCGCMIMMSGTALSLQCRQADRIL